MINRHRPTLLALLTILCATLALPHPASAQTRLYVAPTGNDAWSGTRPGPNRAKTDGPFASLEQARDAIRALKRANRYPSRGVIVELRTGTYCLDKTFKLETEDSGTERGPIIYRAYRREPVRLVGGKRVTGFVPVTDPSILRRLPPEAHEHVLQIDLHAHSITNFGTVGPFGMRWPRDGAGPVELFFDSTAMTLARWPNEGFALVGETDNGKRSRTWHYDGDRPKRWLGEQDIWMHGYWVHDYADSCRQVETIDTTNRTVTLVADKKNGGRAAQGKRYYALNLLPELDRPGEYYIDRATGILYFWPPSPITQGEALVSLLHSVVYLKKTDYVILDHLTIEAARGDGVLVRDGHHNRVVGCAVRNTGQDGIRIRGGTDNAVLGCDIYDTGECGITLWGGDRKTLEPARHYAENNHIHRYARRKRTYRAAVTFKGVGSRASHNLIHNAPHCAFLTGGANDNLIELNEIHSVARESGDVGAYYTYCDWTTRGNVVRHNFFHHIRAPGSGGGSYVIYLDCGPSGTSIYGNVFYKLWKRAIWIGGGRDNTVENNVFVDCNLAVQIKAVVAMKRYRNHSEEGGTLRRNLTRVPYTKPPWSTRYPHLVNILEDEFRMPKYNLVARNICVGGKWLDIDKTAAPHIEVRDNLVDEDPLFVDAANMNFQLRNDSPAFRRIGFKRIPFEKIGLYKAAHRASWPVEAPILELPVPLSEQSAKKARPVFKIARVRSAPRIDGQVQTSEWDGRNPARAMVLERLPNGNRATPRSLAWLASDDRALYVALENEVSAKAPLRTGTAWGGNDAVELAIRNTAAGKSAPTLILRGYVSGRFESCDDGGIPRPVAERLTNGVQYAARVVDDTQWNAEWRIPWASLGIDPAKHRKFAFNLTARKTATKQFVMWCGVGPSWNANGAGVIELE